MLARIAAAGCILLTVAGCSSGSSADSTSDAPDVQAPTAPGGLQASATTSTTISLTWSASTDTGSGVGGYKVFRDAGTVPIATVEVLSHTDTDLRPDTTYEYRVVAFDRAQPPNESQAAILGARTKAETPAADTTSPTPPGNLRATTITQTSVTLAWAASIDSGGSGLAGYRIQRDGTEIAVAGPDATSHEDAGRAASTRYEYEVIAFDAAGNASTPASLGVTTLATPDTTPPPVPANVRATAVGSTRIDLTWDAVFDAGGAGLRGYEVLRDGVQVAAPPSTSHSDTGLTASTTYRYRVRAVDRSSNRSELSDEAQATTAPAAGLDARPSNTTCLATAQPVLNASVSSARAFPNLSFASPVLLLQAPDDSEWYVVEQGGIVRAFENAPAAGTSRVFVDLRDRVNDGASEAGLLGMAFDPEFADNARVYLSYTANPSVAGSVLESRVSRFTAAGGILQPSSEQVLLRVNQPFSNHNGGHIAFGPDGHLYIALGDGGSGGDPQNLAQNRGSLLGKVLRIDVRGPGDYAIPVDNPFAGASRCHAGGSAGSGAFCPEIYAYGLRNPWRFSFDRGASTPELWLGDVGQSAWEEVDRIERGGNYGWRFREGAHCFNPSSGCPTTANGAPLIDPVAEYPRSVGFSITGGYVYRGTAIPSLSGRYVFGDFGSGGVFALIPDAQGSLQRQLLLASGRSISSFGEGNDGTLYFLDYGTGQMHRLTAGSGAPVNPLPTLLSQTGCVLSSDPKQPSSGLIPYAPLAPFWSDGASKQRWMALPDSTTIAVQADGDWMFPNGSVLVKHFSIGTTLIETRLFMRHTDTGNWGGYTYRWNTAQTDATLVSGGLVAEAAGQDWIYPSETQCLQCHTAAAGRTLGLETRQLDSEITYPSTGRTANQLATLEGIGLFSGALTRLPAMPDPFDSTRPLADRARAYLHTNCAQCHRPSGGTPVALDLRYTTHVSVTNTCNAQPASGNLGVANARIVTPGDAPLSVLFLRMTRRDANKMPPVGSHLVDTQGAALIEQWIEGMNASCQ